MNTNNFSLYPTEQGDTSSASVRYDVQVEYYDNNPAPNSLLTETDPSPADPPKRRRRRKAADIFPETRVKCEILESDSQDAYNPTYNASETDPLLGEETNGAGSRRRRRSSVRAESAEERASRLAKMSAYAAQRLANETAEQRATRLRRMSQYAAQRLASETPEQRAVRLQRMSAYAARRIAAETPEQRAARLSRMAAYAAKRHATKKTIQLTDGDGTITDILEKQS